MGARWAWYAKCQNGHIYSGFSGGADNCGECDMPPETEIDCQHHWTGGDCDCKELLENPPLPHSCTDNPKVKALVEAADNFRGFIIVNANFMSQDIRNRYNEKSKRLRTALDEVKDE